MGAPHCTPVPQDPQEMKNMEMENIPGPQLGLTARHVRILKTHLLKENLWILTVNSQVTIRCPSGGQNYNLSFREPEQWLSATWTSHLHQRQTSLFSMLINICRVSCKICQQYQSGKAVSCPWAHFLKQAPGKSPGSSGQSPSAHEQTPSS